MTEYRAWFKSATGQRVTADEIADILDISRATATRRLIEGLDASDVIQVSRALRVNPVMALVDLGHLTHGEALNFLEGDGKLLEGAEPGELALELARQLNPATFAPELDELAARRSGKSDRAIPSEWEGLAVADSSPDHPEEDTDFD